MEVVTPDERCADELEKLLPLLDEDEDDFLGDRVMMKIAAGSCGLIDTRRTSAISVYELRACGAVK